MNKNIRCMIYIVISIILITLIASLIAAKPASTKEEFEESTEDTGCSLGFECFGNNAQGDDDPTQGQPLYLGLGIFCKTAINSFRFE